MKIENQKTSEPKKVIGFRKTCKVSGTGLSHYILIDNSKK
ncbi:MAG: modified peptide precursor CbpA [Candidatus Humimicrobiaceae bacterium]